MRLALGAAQFGGSYGVSNTSGEVSLDEMNGILKRAQDAGITLIDTAIGYGKSEEKLGKLDLRNFKIITKLPKVPNNVIDVQSWVVERAKISLKRLGVSCLETVLLHNSQDALGPLADDLYMGLQKLKSDGIAKKIGVSIYGSDCVNDLFFRQGLEVLQMPVNLIDRSIEKMDVHGQLTSQDVEVHARSVFLQGLLLMGQEEIPSYFEPWSKIFALWHTKLNQLRVNPLAACLSYPIKLKGLSALVIGVQHERQLADVLSAKEEAWAVDPSLFEFMQSDDTKLIDPRNWLID